MVKAFLRNAFISLESFVFPKDPFGRAPRGSISGYEELFSDASSVRHPEVDDFEADSGFALSVDWLHNLALHTQVVFKDSDLNWQHGRLLYSALRQYLTSVPVGEVHVQVFETGSARGFSSICMARALIDSGKSGSVISVDVIASNRRIYWNCIDDHQGRKSRQELLEPWSLELQKVTFLQMLSPLQLDRIGVSRIGFAFLDAQHDRNSVMSEYQFVRDRQVSGDVIFFDDVTPGLFDGVCSAVESIEAEGHYDVTHLGQPGVRAYALAVRR